MEYEDFETQYKHGDIVEIVTTEEYKRRGGDCTERCAIAQFAGSICEIDDLYIGEPMIGGTATLIPITEKRNFEVEYARAITSYHWQYRSIKRVEKEDDPELACAFDDVFD